MIQLQFVAQNDLGSQLIRLYDHGRYSHVDYLTASGQLIGARLDGVKIRPTGYSNFSRIARVSVFTDAENEERFDQFIRSQVGKPYDRTAIVAFAVQRDWREEDSWFCSELQAAGIEKAGIFPFPFVDPANKITPDGLLTALALYCKIDILR